MSVLTVNIWNHEVHGSTDGDEVSKLFSAAGCVHGIGQRQTAASVVYTVWSLVSLALDEYS